MTYSNLGRNTQAALWLALFVVSACRAEPWRKRTETRASSDDSGSICVEKLPAARPLEEYYGPKPRPGSKSVFLIILNDADTVTITSGAGGFFGKLKYAARHRVRILLDDKPREAFTFDFKERGSSQLCLFYRKPYGTWSLEPVAWRKNTCACPEGSSNTPPTLHKIPQSE